MEDQKQREAHADQTLREGRRKNEKTTALDEMGTTRS